MTGTLSESARDRQKMIEENLGLVHSCAHRFKGRGIEYDDLFQAGCMGLVKACDAFDFSRGVRFSTYAVPVILGEMRRLFRDGGTVKVSRSLKELSLRVVRGREQLAVRLGRDPTIEELAEELGLTREEVVEALNVSAPPLSLTVSSEEGETQIDLPVQSPEENLSERMALRQTPGPAAHHSAVLYGQDPDPDGGTAGDDPGTGLPPGKETAPRHAAETPVILLLRSTYLLSALRSLWLRSAFLYAENCQSGTIVLQFSSYI